MIQKRTILTILITAAIIIVIFIIALVYFDKSSISNKYDLSPNSNNRFELVKPKVDIPVENVPSTNILQPIIPNTYGKYLQPIQKVISNSLSKS